MRDELFNEGHYRLANGRCSTTSFAKDFLLANTSWLNVVGEAFLDEIQITYPLVEFDGFVGAQTHGSVLASTVGVLSKLRHGETKLTFRAERDGSGFFIRPALAPLIAGKKLFLLEDMIDTGKTVKKVIALSVKYGFEVIAVIAMLNRHQDIPYNLRGLLVTWLASVELPEQSFPCEQCSRRIPFDEDYSQPSWLNKSWKVIQTLRG